MFESEVSRTVGVFTNSRLTWKCKDILSFHGILGLSISRLKSEKHPVEDGQRPPGMTAIDMWNENTWTFECPSWKSLVQE